MHFCDRWLPHHLYFVQFFVVRQICHLLFFAHDWWCIVIALGQFICSSYVDIIRSTAETKMMSNSTAYCLWFWYDPCQCTIFIGSKVKQKQNLVKNAPLTIDTMDNEFLAEHATWCRYKFRITRPHAISSNLCIYHHVYVRTDTKWCLWLSVGAILQNSVEHKQQCHKFRGKIKFAIVKRYLVGMH